MIEQVGNAVDFYAFFVASKVGKTGLVDVTIDVYRAGTLIVTAASATEVGGGLYRYTLVGGSATVVGEYVGIFKTADATVDQQWIPMLWVIGRGGIENLDALISSRAAAGATVTVASPVAVDGTTLDLVRGDDYTNEWNRHLTFTSATWPNLTGATRVVMTIRRRKEAFGTGSDPVILVREDKLASRVVGVGSQILVFELTSGLGALIAPNIGDTGDLLIGTASGKYDIEATLSDADIVTLVVGTVNVTEDQTRA